MDSYFWLVYTYLIVNQPQTIYMFRSTMSVYNVTIRLACFKTNGQWTSYGYAVQHD